VEAAYVLVVAVVATWGFVAGSTALILSATVLTLPAGVAALVGYYVLYGVLALVPGANPDSASGSSCSSHCATVDTGGLATWFGATTTVLGVVLVVGAALVNLALLRAVRSKQAVRG
jgi:hypothetical protein